MPNFWGPKKDIKGDQFFYHVSDFCKNCNHDSSYHTTAVGECLVDIWFAEICQLTLCIFESQSVLSKSTGLLYGSTASCRSIQCCMYTNHCLCYLISSTQVQLHCRLDFFTYRNLFQNEISDDFSSKSLLKLLIHSNAHIHNYRSRKKRWILELEIGFRL